MQEDQNNDQVTVVDLEDDDALDLGSINFIDPVGKEHELPIVGYHVLAPQKGYLLIIGNKDTEEHVSSKELTILKFEDDKITSIETESEYKEASEIFKEEFSGKAVSADA